MSKTLKVDCPSCGKSVVWSSDNPFRPFCCERCRLIDLGEWASGNHRIPSDAEHDDVTESDLQGDDRAY